MKNYLKLTALLGIAALSVPSAQAVLIHGWDYSNLDPFGPGADWSTTPANFGAIGTGVFSTTAFEQLDSVGGTNLGTFQVTTNDGTDVGTSGTSFSTSTNDPAAIAIFNSGVNGKGVVVQFSTLGFDTVDLQYAVRVGSTAANNNFWEYSLNGTDYTTITGATDSGLNVGEYVLRNHNLGTVTAINNQPAVFLRYTLGGSTATGANPESALAIDNLQINAVPEPATMAALASLVVMGFALIRRRIQR